MVIDYRSQTVLLTGASSGIGASFATALASRGANLVLVARRADRLESLAYELHHTHGVKVEAIPFDLASPTVGSELSKVISNRGIVVTSLINNAGFGTFGPFAGEDPNRLAEEIAVDVCAPVQLTATFLPQLLDAGNGFLINVASIAAYFPVPFMAVYSAAKAFMLSFTESLWAELRDTGLTVFALSPGPTSTEFNSVVGTDDATSGLKIRTPEDVVNTALAHLDRRNPGPNVIDGRANRIATSASRFPSRRMIVKMIARVTDPDRRSKPVSSDERYDAS